MKILIADDDKLSLSMLDRALINLGYEVVKVSDGQAAWDILQQPDAPQLIILDWIMPKIDGIDVIKKACSRENAPLLYSIMLTSHNTTDKIVEGFEAGIDDYIVKPFEKFELIARIKVGERTIRLKNDLRHQNEVLFSQNQMLNNDLEVSKKFMLSLLPDEPTKFKLFQNLGYKLISRIDSCSKVGGDVITLIQNNVGTFTSYLFDISGHGVSAALSASALNTYLRTDLAFEQNPDKTLLKANSYVFNGNLLPNTHVTAAVLHLKPNGLVEFSNAGHPPIIVFNKYEAKYYPASTIPVGMFDDSKFSPTLEKIELDPSDTLVVVSDGFIEMKSKSGQYMGLDGLALILKHYALSDLDDMCESVYSTLSSWIQDSELEDDCSFLAIRFQPS